MLALSLRRAATTLVAAVFALSLSTTFVAAEEEDAAISDFTLKDLKGKSTSLHESLAEGPVLISFWATWCKPCKQEMPHLVDLYEDWDEAGLTVLAISIDQPRSMAQVRKYVSSEKFPFTVLLDPNKDAFRKLQGQSVPYVVLLDGTGEPSYVKSGYRPGDEKYLAEAVAALFPADTETGESTPEGE